MLNIIFDISYYNILKYLDIKSIIHLTHSNIHVFDKKYIKKIIDKKCYLLFYRFFKKYIGYIHVFKNNTIKGILFLYDNKLLKNLRAIYYYRYYPRHLVPIYINIANNYIDKNEYNIYNPYELYKLIKLLKLSDIIEIGW
jgi:hypothetical protein